MKIKSKFWLASTWINNLNAIIWISVGWRNFSKTRIKELSKYALENFDKVMILLVDSIKKYNFMAFGGLSLAESEIKAKKEWLEYGKAVQSIIKSFEDENIDTSRISVLHWESAAELIPSYRTTLELLKSEYKINPIFKKDCLDMTDKYIETKNIQEVGEAKKEIAVQFLLHELSLFLFIGQTLNYCIDIYPGKFPVIENIINWKYEWPLKELSNNVLYWHIEIEWDV